MQVSGIIGSAFNSKVGNCPDAQGSVFKLQDQYWLTVSPKTSTTLGEIALAMEQSVPVLVYHAD
jgi:hypothetical protein